MDTKSKVPRVRGGSSPKQSSGDHFAALQRAKGYPYPRPPSSFLFINGRVLTFPDSQWRGVQHLPDLLVEDNATGEQLSYAAALQKEKIQLPMAEPEGQEEYWMPILAIGSNAAPEQLARKFPNSMFPAGVVILVVQCILEDFDVVYAPLISSYGSCTATLEVSPGTKVNLFITYLTPPLQERMHQTEGAYDLLELTDICLHEGLSLNAFKLGQAAATLRDKVYQYNHQYGTLHMPVLTNSANQPPADGHNSGRKAWHTPVSLAEIPALGRHYPSLTQVQMQRALKALLKPAGGPTDGCVHDHVEELSHADNPPDKVDAFEDLTASSDGSMNEEDDPPDVVLPLSPELMAGGGLMALPGPDEDQLQDWIAANLLDKHLRYRHVAALTDLAVPFQYSQSKHIMSLGHKYSSNVK